MNRKVIAEKRGFRRGLGLGALFGLLFGIGGSKLAWFYQGADAPAVVISAPEKDENQGQQSLENSLTSHKTEMPNSQSDTDSANANPIQESVQDIAPELVTQLPYTPADQTRPAAPEPALPAAPPSPRDTYESLRQSFDAKIGRYLRQLANSAIYNNANVSKYQEILITDQELDNYLNDRVSSDLHGDDLYNAKTEALRALENEILTIIKQ
jgi:hypothetical protein